MFSSGSIRLFRVAGIQVLLHWSWLLVAVYMVTSRRGLYASWGWNVAEYVALFGIVLLHEFGHSLASRQVGGESKEILLWPFGGIAFVRVPPRPGAELWSIAAGPLVNVALWPLLASAFWLTDPPPYAGLLWDFWGFFNGEREFYHALFSVPEFQRFVIMMYHVNLLLLIFNMLPIYPLDGGQVFRSLLWFVVGRARSLQIAVIVGLAGVAWLFYSAYESRSIFRGFIALFLLQECLRGWQHAKSLQSFSRLPTHPEFRCPTCKQSPPGGPLWLCESCGHRFDPFSTTGACPHCTTPQARTLCPTCGTAHEFREWTAAGASPGER